MTAHPYATYLRAALVLTLVLTGGAFVIATAQDQPKETLTADEAIACIQTAVATDELHQRSRRRRGRRETPL